ncbi:Bor1p Ecym_1078 [Eremothecium cymbalariae DBVPG|uniref:Bicarbonate transporter-like transmembrane domain-containing protein n=1 Tax=Eremothecium cymbalariae (strain CBS 270.75 / DBVPG 7215 / KCTC 17166 / NRRL Y-17582) TaxID=931890 RepID=G8JMC7_ERECY|nr:hypothetical protein Ecym_1078 [Eremothecium cymbalariae DBVPG\
MLEQPKQLVDQDDPTEQFTDPKSFEDEEQMFTNNVDKTGKNKRFPPLFSGIMQDIKDRLPYYRSDWTDSWDYRVIPVLVETYLNNLLPAIAFAQDMFDHTDNAFGVNEVLLSSAIGGIVFGIFCGQPLCILGVTAPVSIFNYTVYEIIKPWGIDYFGFMFWICIWAMICHLLLAITNMVCLLQYVSSFPCDVFGLFNNIVYIHKGIEILTRQFNDNGKTDLASGYASIVVALIMTLFGSVCKLSVKTSLFPYSLRTFISDYSTVAAVLFGSLFIHFGGYVNDIHFQKLHITHNFTPTSKLRGGAGWLAYHSIPTRYIFLALPFGIILTILFYFDHNVSSLMAQRNKYKLKKPSTFHYDFALLSLTTGLSGLLGVPAPNGLIPQAPLHTEALLVRDNNGKIVRCVEQRFTNTGQGLLMIATMTKPLLTCLGQIPQAALSGLFFVMAIQGLVENAIIRKLLWLLTERSKRGLSNPLSNIPPKTILIFTTLGIVGALIEYGLTLSKAAIAFPIALVLTVVLSLSFPKWFSKATVPILDEPVAEPFTRKNLLFENLH